MLPLLVLLSLSTSSETFHLTEVADIAVAVQQYFFTRSTVLLMTREILLQSSHKIFILHKLLAERGMMKSFSQELQYMDCCQHSRPLFLMVSNGLEDRRHLDYLSSSSCLSSAVWLLFLNITNTLDAFLADTNIPFNCEFLVAQKERDHVVDLTEVHRVMASLPLQTCRFGHWTAHGGLICAPVGLCHRRNRLNGTVLNTAVKKEYLDDTLFEFKLRTDSFFNQVWLTLEILLEFRSEFTLPKENTYGKQMKNGSWDGIMGLMARNDVDVTSVELTMEPMRSDVVDYIAPLTNDREYLFIKNLNIFESSWTSFLQPFDCWLWLAVLVTVVLLSVSLCLTCRCSCRFGHEDPDTEALTSLSGSLFVIYTTLCRQGSGEVPQCISGCFVYMVAHLAIAVLLAAYSAFFISYLTFRRPVLPFSSFSELLNDSTYQLGAHAASSYLRTFDMEYMEPPPRDVYWKQIISRVDDLPNSEIEGFRRVCARHKYTFLFSLKYAEHSTESVPCQLSIVPNAFIPETYAMALVKGSPYLRLFRQAMHKLRATGILKRLDKNINSEKPKKEPSTDINMDFASVAPIFGILAVGLVLAILVLLLEFSVRRMKIGFVKINLSDRP